MSVPMNPTSIAQFRQLLDVIDQTNDPSAEIKMWINDDYASIEIRSHGLPINAIRLSLGAAPMEADQLAEVERRSQR